MVLQWAKNDSCFWVFRGESLISREFKLFFSFKFVELFIEIKTLIIKFDCGINIFEDFCSVINFLLRRY